MGVKVKYGKWEMANEWKQTDRNEMTYIGKNLKIFQWTNERQHKRIQRSGAWSLCCYYDDDDDVDKRIIESKTD